MRNEIPTTKLLSSCFQTTVDRLPRSCMRNNSLRPNLNSSNMLTTHTFRKLIAIFRATFIAFTHLLLSPLYVHLTSRPFLSAETCAPLNENCAPSSVPVNIWRRGWGITTLVTSPCRPPADGVSTRMVTTSTHCAK
jgi:hypothetical protein